MNIKNILEKFNLSKKSKTELIYPYAPVYKITENKKTYVAKQTISVFDEALSLTKYLNYLTQSGVNIVAPVPLKSTNPKKIDKDVWVIYPFIHGDKYSALDSEIIEAGRLLGKIHSLSPSNHQENFSEYDEYEFSYSDIESDIDTIEGYLLKYQIDIDIKMLQCTIKKAIENQEILKKQNLPLVASPYDYKADNLVYLANHKPVIIDPDNATTLPRIFDLALSLLLFHNVLKSAPNRIFTTDEWALFMQGYNEYITLSDKEKSCWSLAIKHLFLDEVLWLMADFEQGWEDPRQRELFISLCSFILNEKIVAQYSLCC